MINITNQNVFVKVLFKNIASLGFVQIANYIIPIFITPFVVRSLGTSSFGIASYAQNIVGYFTILVYFGFEYSATQDIAINRNDKEKLIKIFWSVIIMRLLLFILSIVLLCIMYFFLDRIRNNPFLYFNASLLNLGIALFPTWFFQGIESMGKMSLFNFVIKLLSAILIILFVSSPNDYQLYISILSLSYVVVGLFAFFYVIKHYNMCLIRINFKDTFIRKVIAKGFPIFLNNLFMSAYTLIGMTILGYYVNNSFVGIYSGAYRIIMAIISMVSLPINVGLFPLMSRLFKESKSQGYRYLKKAILIVSLLSALLSIITYLGSPLIVLILLGHNFEAAIPLLRLFSILPLLVVVASMLTVQGLYGLQMQKYAPLLGFFVALICVVFNITFIPLYGIMGAGYAWIIAQICEIFISSLIIMVKK